MKRIIRRLVQYAKGRNCPMCGHYMYAIMRLKNYALWKLFYGIGLFCLLFSSCAKEIEPEWVNVATGTDETTLPQKVVDAQKYDAFPASKRTIYFHEDFNNNANAWPLLSPITSISGGVFFSTGRATLITLMKPIDESKDFEVEVIIGFRDLLSPGNNGFIWNYNTTTKKYWGFFDYLDPNNVNEEISQSGLFNNGNIEISTGQKALTGHNANGIAWNKYTMRKVGEYIITFIDDQRISTKKYITTQGNRLGINDPGGIGIDKIYIDYIN